MIITPDLLKEQIYNRVKEMIAKCKDNEIEFEQMIVTSHNICSKFGSVVTMHGIEKNRNASPSILMTVEHGNSSKKANLSLFNIDDIYSIYQKLSLIITPSPAIHTELADEA
jgi:hypothetical protein